MNTDQFVAEVIKLAKQAGKAGEVPVGAIVVGPDGKIIGRGANKTHASRDGLMHAEMVAIRQAEKHIGDWRLDGCELYVTLEPCLMCLGAAGNARINQIYYLVADPLFGSIASKLTANQVKKLFPKMSATKLPGGDIVQRLMADFFTELRRNKNKWPS